MAYDDYQMGGYIPGDYETEEERRRRLEREAAYGAAQDAEDAAMGAAMTANADRGGFMDVAGRYVDNRVNAAQQRMNSAGQMFTDPGAALERRMGMAAADVEQPVEPTPVKQTITTDPVTGEQKMKIEGSVQDLSAANPLTPTVSGPAVPQAPEPAPAPAPASVTTQNPQATQAAVARMQAAAAASQPPAAAVPAELPAQGAIDPNAPMPNIGRPAQFGPGVQVAGGPPGTGVAQAAQAATTPTGQAQVAAPSAAPNLAQAGAQAQATTPRPQWAVDLEAAGTDQTKLIDIAANRTYPEDVRKDAKEKLRTAMASADAASEAEKTVTAAAQGDPRAQQKLLNSIKPSTIKKEEDGRVTEGSYIRAYLYARLGLSDLAQEEQQKIMGKNKFGQVQVNGQSYEVETDRTGRVITARDNEGNKVDAPILNKIRAEATKFGVQAFGFTGGISTVPSTGEPLQARQNSISGDAEYVHMTGPKKGQVYTGSEIPVQQRVGTQAMVDYNKKLIDFNTNPNIAGATELMKIAVGNDRGDGAEIAKAKTDIANKMGVGGLAQILGGGPGAVPAPAAPVQRPVTQAAPAPAVAASAPAPAVAAPAPAAAAGGVPLAYTPSAKRAGESENMYQSRVKREEAAFNAEIQRRKEMQLALEKPAAAAAGADAATTVKNQAFADRTYDLMKPINEAILKSTGSSIGAGVDTVAAAFAKSTEGSKAISRLNVLSYGILSNIPRFEGPQSDIDVQMYKQAAGDFANRKLPVEDRLAALDALRTILQRYDKAGKNDWNFGSTGSTGSTGQAAGGGTTSSGNKYKRVQ